MKKRTDGRGKESPEARLKRVFTRRYTNPCWTLQRIADSEGVSTARVRQWLVQAEKLVGLRP